MEHACTATNLVRVRAANRRREGPPAEQGTRHEHAPLHEGRQRETPGDHLGRVREGRVRPRPRRVRERRLDEADAEALIRRPRGGPWWAWRSAPPPWPPSLGSGILSAWAPFFPCSRRAWPPRSSGKSFRN